MPKRSKSSNSSRRERSFRISNIIESLSATPRGACRTSPKNQMSDIFLSYERDNLDAARKLAQALETHGWSVWWDRRIPAGKEFDEVIEEAIGASRSVIVLWSSKSVSSRWVRTEAAEGADRKILVPVLIEKAKIPFAFRRIHAADFTAWNGKDSEPSFQRLIEDLTALLGPTSKKKQPPPKKKKSRQPAPSSGLAPGTTKQNPKDGLDYVWIPPGSFAMGCSSGDSEAYDEEKPSHHVTISKGFWLGKTPVTVGSYRRFVQETGSEMPSELMLVDHPLNPGWKDHDQPIVMVTWDEARAYCEWAGGRLPTEAEWEYAARAGTKSARYGDLNAIAWSADNSGKPLDSTHAWNVTSGKDWGKYEKLLKANGNQIKPVGLKRGNPWGLDDVLGNVWEWCSDWYVGDYYTPSPATDPKGPNSGTDRVVRGGS